jgi:hypothetical protein
MRGKIYLFLTACALVAVTACVTSFATGGADEGRDTPSHRAP